MSGDQVNSNRNEGDDATEESSDEDERDSNAINPSSSLHASTSSNEEITHHDEQSNEPADHPKWLRDQVFEYFWCWYQLILTQLVIYIASGWEWLTSILIGISRSFNENCHRHCRSADAFMIISMLFAITLIVTQIPVNVDNAGTHIIEMPDDVNNASQSLSTINEDAELNNDATVNPVAHNEDLRRDIEVIDDEYTLSEEAVDNRTYDSDSFIFDAILYDINVNHEEEIHSITTDSDSIIDDNDESPMSEISLDWSDKDDQADYDFNITNNKSSEDDSSVDMSDTADGGYDTRSDSSLSSQISNGANDDDGLIDENDSNFFSDHGYDTNDEHSSVDNNDDDDDDARSLLSDIIYEPNNANDPTDDDDRWSDISHITDNWSEDDDEEVISTDDGYSSKSETDSLIGDGDVILLEIENNPPLDVSSYHLLSTDDDQSELMSSMDPSADDRLNDEVAFSSQVFGNHPGGVDPLVLSESQDLTDSNSDHDEMSEQINNGENSLHTDNQRDHTGQTISSSKITSNNVQDKPQTHETETSQTYSSGASSRPMSQMERTTIDKNEEMEHSTGSMNLELQKQSGLADKRDKERLKQNI